MKFFFVKFGGVAIFGATSEQSPKIFSAKILLSSKVFFRESFPLHGSMKWKQDWFSYRNQLQLCSFFCLLL